MELTAAGRTYVIGRLDAFKQLHVSRKLAPIVMALQKSLVGLKPEDFAAAKEDEARAQGLFASASNPMVEAFSTMENKDVDYIIEACLDVCQAKDPATGALSPVRAGGKLMFDDIDMAVLMRLTFVVVKENLGDFFLNPLGAILPPKS